MRGPKRRLSPALFEAAAPVGDASDTAPPPPVEVTGENRSASSIPPGLRQYNAPTLQQPPQPWLDQSDTPLPLRVSKEQEQPTATGGESPPMVPPNDGDTAGAASPDPSANFAGGGAFHADTTVVSPPEPVAGIPAAGVEPLGLSRIETDYANLLFLAISLEKLARDEIAKLSGERPNDRQTVENNKKQCDLLSILADGFARLSAALVEYSERPQRLLLGKAKQIVDEVGAQLKAWWKANAAEATDWCIRLPMLTASIGALGLVGADMSFATPVVGVLVGGQKAATVINAAIKRRKQS
jgi:hypothetical protein